MLYYYAPLPNYCVDCAVRVPVHLRVYKHNVVARSCPKSAKKEKKEKNFLSIKNVWWGTTLSLMEKAHQYFTKLLHALGEREGDVLDLRISANAFCT